jgi:hypothetical protein
LVTERYTKGEGSPPIRGVLKTLSVIEICAEFGARRTVLGLDCATLAL